MQWLFVHPNRVQGGYSHPTCFQFSLEVSGHVFSVGMVRRLLTRVVFVVT